MVEKYKKVVRIAEESEREPLTCDRCGFWVMITFAIEGSDDRLCFDCMDELARKD